MPEAPEIRIDFDEARHPDWHRYNTRWRMAQSFWRGGLHILDPDYPATNIPIATELTQDDTAGGVDPEPDIDRIRYKWTTSPANSFLFKHQRETLAEYEDRHQRMINLPLFQYVCNVLASGVLRDKPIREGASSPAWKQLHTDIDNAGTDVNAFMRRALSLGLVFGRVHAVTDRVAFDDEARSRGEQRSRGERPYSYLITPLELVDYVVDQHGQFVWATVMEVQPDARKPGQIPGETQGYGTPLQYRVWDRTSWTLYRKPSSDHGAAILSPSNWEIVGGPTPHGTPGRVPISTLFCTKFADARTMACESPVADVLDLNRDIVNKLSELDELERAQTFGLLAIPEADGSSAGGIDIGPFRAFTFPAGAGAPAYIDPNPEHPTGKWARIQEKLHTARQLAPVGRGKAEYSKEERATSAISAERQDMENQMAWWSKALQSFDEQTHDNLAKLAGESSAPTVAYPSNFDTRALGNEVSDALALASIPVVTEARETVAAFTAPVIRRMMMGQGVEVGVIDKAISALDTVAKKEKEPTVVVRPPKENDEAAA